MPPTTLRAGIYGRQSSGRDKSIADQVAEATADIHRRGWTVAETHTDKVGASRHSRQVRDAWPRVLDAIDAKRWDVLVLWESSRGDRDLPTWASMLALCRTRGVLIHITSHQRTYDMSHARDWRTLAEDGIDSAYETEKLSLRVRRGTASAAQQGRPAGGAAPYGYRRMHDPRTGALIGQEPDPDTAPIAAEIIRSIARSETITGIKQDLTAAGIPTPRRGQWSHRTIRQIASNPVYIGMRRHHGDTHPAGWDPLVDEVTWWAAQRVLSAPGRWRRGDSRPGSQRHLLTYLGVCHRGHLLRSRVDDYICPPGCVGMRRRLLDELVTDVLVARLSRPDAYAVLAVADSSDAEVEAARAEVARLEGRLGEWRRSAARGDTTPASLAVIEAELAGQIASARRRAERAGLPPALRSLLEPGADMRRRWEALAVPGRRAVVRALLSVRLLPAGRRRTMSVHERVELTWLVDG